jgi:NADH-quinone oxidoreductase subunit C
MRSVAREEWLPAVSGLVAAGFGYLDFLTAVDRVEELEVIAHVVNPTSLERLLLGTRVPSGDAHVASLASVLPAAGWHERETAEMFGIEFDGHPDPRPLLRRTDVGAPPLLASTVLAARAVIAWPGAAEAESGKGSRRRQLPPGVPDGWLQGSPT